VCDESEQEARLGNATLRRLQSGTMQVPHAAIAEVEMVMQYSPGFPLFVSRKSVDCLV
jgi:hypothetical protein